MALAAGAPLVVRRRWPLPVLGVVLAASVVAVLLGMHGAAMGLPVAVACYPVAQSVAPRRSTVAFAAAVSGIVLAGVISASASSRVLAPNPDALNSDLVSSLGVSLLALVTAWALGRSARARHRYTTVLADHRAQQAVAEERLRIAREMHDVVAHSMSVIVMKAAVANHVYDSRPEESREALGVIESVGRGALADIGSVLGSLRSAGEADLTPSPGLDALPTLVQNARLAGVDVELDRADLPELPAALQLSAYRIVQEALTNVIKHAAPARCAVRVTAESGELCLTVVDDGTRGADREPGHGLIGMRERAALHHGTLLADRRPDGGFAVHARLPYQGADPHD
jgi:signal transduction histidine kinase